MGKRAVGNLVGAAAASVLGNGVRSVTMNSNRRLNQKPKRGATRPAVTDRKLNGKFSFGGAYRPYAPIYVDIKAKDARGRTMAINNFSRMNPTMSAMSIHGLTSLRPM